MSRAENKASRLLQIEAMLLSHPEGLAQSDIARRLGVNRSTVGRYLPDLPKHIYIDDDGRWRLDREAYLVQVRFSLHESLAVHLASRLLATRMDRQNPHAAAALRKLGAALERLAPRISQHLGQSADIMDDVNLQRQDPVYLQALEKLTLAWAEQRKTRIWHRLEATDQVYQYTFSPYFIEPYAVGQTTHVIGWREPPGAQRTFKIERIERIELLREHYEIPAGFNPRSLLADAWGIWYTEAEPIEVQLRFHPRVARRVSETRWHRSQIIETQPDGSLLWRASVAEPHEMMSWIRGWGADVEVLAPEGLRGAMTREARSIAKNYGIQEIVPEPREWLLWAKAESDTQNFHPLVCHMLDVGQTALALWKHALPVYTQRQFSEWLGLDAESTGRLLAFWASLHDLGKAAPSFQRKVAAAVHELEIVGFSFPPPSPKPARHGAVSAWCLKPLLTDHGLLSEDHALLVARALGGHHGEWPTPAELGPTALKSSDRGNEVWDAARLALFQTMVDIFQPSMSARLPEDQTQQNAFLTLLSGLVSVADWIGSMTEYFPFSSLPASISAYATRASTQARQAIEQLGWVGWQSDGSPQSFNEMFPFKPNPIQQHVIEHASNCAQPALAIIEAPTGIGKTEMALYLADTWLQHQRGRGIYIAMPTQATSNQMYERVVRFLTSRYPQDLINLHLVHGAALLEAQNSQALPVNISDEGDILSGSIKAQTWFLPRKRTLLAPFGVGTVDQALMSILQTRHFFVRLFGLGQKVVIFDEVHAYDTYMSTLFEWLLVWLRSIGTSVILLTATLPEATRQSLLKAWTGIPSETLDTPYPRLTLVDQETARTIALPAPQTRQVHLEKIGAKPENVVTSLKAALQNGGCAAVICNRVARAQEIYRAVEVAHLVDPADLILFHARFPAGWRADIEQNVLQRFGKSGQRPKKSIVIATQVIEQSLDLDFDFMISDLAPIDLLLQRAGRLHRHPQHDIDRPADLRRPLLALALPELAGDLPDFGSDEYVYDRVILLRTWHTLLNCSQFTLPQDTSPLIEAVYGKDANAAIQEPDIAQAILQAQEKMERDQTKEVAQARGRLIARPDDEGLMTDPNQNLEEDNPKVHQTFQALTRLAEPSVTLICLFQIQHGLHLSPEEASDAIDLKTEPDQALTRLLLKNAVNVQHQSVVRYILEQTPHPAWKKIAALRHCYPVVFDAKGICDLPETHVRLHINRETGLEIQKEAQ